MKNSNFYLCIFLIFIALAVLASADTPLSKEDLCADASDASCANYTLEDLCNDHSALYDYYYYYSATNSCFLKDTDTLSNQSNNTKI